VSDDDVIPGVHQKEPYRPYDPAEFARRRSGWDAALTRRELNPVEERDPWDGVSR
jgi:hypothetical protein